MNARIGKHRSVSTDSLIKSKEGKIKHAKWKEEIGGAGRNTSTSHLDRPSSIRLVTAATGCYGANSGSRTEVGWKFGRDGSAALYGIFVWRELPCP